MSELLTLAAALDKHSEALNAHAAALHANGGTEATTKTRKPRTTAEAPVAPAAPAAAAIPTTAATAAAPVAPAAPAAPAAAAPAAASAPTGSAEPTLQKVADAIIDLANNVSREAAVSVLTKYGAQKVPQIKKEDFPAVLVDVATLKAGGSLAAAGLM